MKRKIAAVAMLVAALVGGSVVTSTAASAGGNVSHVQPFGGHISHGKISHT